MRDLRIAGICRVSLLNECWSGLPGGQPGPAARKGTGLDFGPDRHR